MGGYIAIGVLVVLILILVVSSIHVVQQSKAFVVERLGSFSAVWGNGLHWKWPFIERVVKKISLKEQRYIGDEGEIHVYSWDGRKETTLVGPYSVRELYLEHFGK